MTDDANLLRRYVQAGSESAYTEFVQRHLRLVYFCALRHTGGRTDLAQDAAQKVFIQAARKAAGLSSRPSVAGWLYTAARFAARDLMRAERRRTARERIADEISRGPEVVVDAAGSVRAAIDELLSRLSEKDRELILLHCVEEASVDEIARQCELTEAAVRKRIERAIERLRITLRKRGIASSAAMLGSVLSESKALSLPPTVFPGVCKAVFTFAPPASGILSTWLEAAHAVGGLTAMVAILGIGIAWFETAATRETKSTWSDLRRSRDVAADRLRRAERELSAIQARASAARPAADQTAVSRRDQAANASRTEARKLGLKFLAAHPEVQKLIAAEARDHEAWWLGTAGRHIGLTPDQIARVVALRTQVGNNTITMGFDAGEVVLNQSLGTLTDAEGNRAIEAVLGDKAYAEYQDYNRSAIGVQSATRAAAELNAAGMPITPGQTQALEQIIENASPEYQKGGSIDPRTLDWGAIDEQARGFLNSDQMQAIAAMRAAQEAQNADRLAGSSP